MQIQSASTPIKVANAKISEDQEMFYDEPTNCTTEQNS